MHYLKSNILIVKKFSYINYSFIFLAKLCKEIIPRTFFDKDNCNYVNLKKNRISKRFVTFPIASIFFINLHFYQFR